MYKFPYFTETDMEKILSFMNEYPFCIITGMDKDYPIATHIPVRIEKREEKIFLTGHMMKGAEHQEAFEKHNKVLVIFNGPHTYVSASWYTSPRQGSTWNYITVHARGKIHFLGESETLQAVKSITEQYEGSASVASFDQLPQEYISKMVKGIVAFSIEIEKLENVFKLSQNHDETTRHTIIEQLEKKGESDALKIANEMKKRLAIPKQ